MSEEATFSYDTELKFIRGDTRALTNSSKHEEIEKNISFFFFIDKIIY